MNVLPNTRTTVGRVLFADGREIGSDLERRLQRLHVQGDGLELPKLDEDSEIVSGSHLGGNDLGIRESLAHR